MAKEMDQNLLFVSIFHLTFLGKSHHSMTENSKLALFWRVLWKEMTFSSPAPHGIKAAQQMLVKSLDFFVESEGLLLMVSYFWESVMPGGWLEFESLHIVELVCSSKIMGRLNCLLDRESNPFVSKVSKTVSLLLKLIGKIGMIHIVKILPTVWLHNV